jgi:GH35 family endo-1,4-beta-xylanase
MNTTRLLAALLAASALVTGAAHGAEHVIDQRDRKYQIATEHLANAARALAVAQAELKKAEASHPLPGLDLVRMLSQIKPVEETINVILAPERKRYEFQTITPDGTFFTPTRAGDQ